MKFALLAGVLLALGCADPAPSSSPIAVEHAAYIGGGNIDCWTGIDGYLEAAYLGPMAGTTNTYNLYVVPFRAGSGTPDDPYYTPEVYYQIYGDGINGGHSPQCWADTPIAWSENPPGYGYSLRDVRKHVLVRARHVLRVHLAARVELHRRAPRTTRRGVLVHVHERRRRLEPSRLQLLLRHRRTLILKGETS